MNDAAFQLGQAAFANGKPCIPAMDVKLMAMGNGKAATVENFREFTKLSTAWIKGWTMANLNAPIT